MTRATVLSVAPFRRLIGLHVTNVRLGVGSFLTLDLADATSSTTGRVWLYLADWAIVQAGSEVLASDALPGNQRRTTIPALVDRTLDNVAKLDDEELHLEFSDGIRIEIWENREAYGLGAEAVHVFLDSHLIETLRFPMPHPS